MFAYKYEIAALLAAFCWTIAGTMASEPSKRLGAMAFTRLRMTQVFFMLMLIMIINQGWQLLNWHNFSILFISGVIGIFIGDVALFSAMRRIGPRRTGVMFTTNGPMSVALGYLYLNETISIFALLGCLSVAIGVMIVIMTRTNTTHALEQQQGSLKAAVIFGLIAALGQAIGAIIAKPVLVDGLDAFTASGVRVTGALVCLYLMLLSPSRKVRSLSALTKPMFWNTFFSGLLAMTIGMSLVLYGLSGGKTGLIMTLSSVTPVMILPVLWLKTGVRPTLLAWLGAVIVVFGSSLIFIY